MSKKNGLFGGLFGGKKSGGCCQMEIVEETGSCCSAPVEAASERRDAACCPEKIRCIKVLGAGCKNCREQYEAVKEAVKRLGLSVDVEYITDMEKVMAYGAMSMPAIVVNEKVASMGKALKSADVEKLLHKLGF